MTAEYGEKIIKDLLHSQADITFSVLYKALGQVVREAIKEERQECANLAKKDMNIYSRIMASTLECEDPIETECKFIASRRIYNAILDRNEERELIEEDKQGQK